MRRRVTKKLMAVTMAIATTVSLVGCGNSSDTNVTSEDKLTQTAVAGEVQNAGTQADEGISEDSPYRGMGFDLSEHETIRFYSVGERPQDTDMVLEKINKEYLEPWLNTTLEVEFISWGDLGTKYSLLLSGGDKCDLIFTSSWCNYNSEVGNGAFKELDREWIQKYMPLSYPIQASESWDQISISGKIYAVPSNSATFTGYNVITFRKDILDKYGITDINSWDTMKEALYTIAENEGANGLYANGQRSSNEFGDHLWNQYTGVDALAFDFMYYTHNSEELPDWDKDVFYKYTSDNYYQYCEEMAEMAAHNVWSPTRINDTSDPQQNFISGKTASIIWNGAAVSTGIEMEKTGIGTFEVFDVTPNALARRDSYANSATAIPASCENPERAALVLDCLKGNREVNTLIVGGIEGVHYTLVDGKHKATDVATNYPWGGWAWSLQDNDSPAEYTEDSRNEKFGNICDAKEYAPKAAGFSFDTQPVETEMAVINSIIEEYAQSFNLGIFGDDTKAKYDEFVDKLNKAGLDKVEKECKNQYMTYCESKKN